MVVVNWTHQSREDLRNIGAYISRDSPQYAAAQLERFLAAVKVLEHHPEFGKPVPELENPEVREILVGTYRIIYRLVNESTIDIITVHHSRRLLDKSQFVRLG